MKQESRKEEKMYRRRRYRRTDWRVWWLLGYPAGIFSLLIILALILTPVVLFLKLLGINVL